MFINPELLLRALLNPELTLIRIAESLNLTLRELADEINAAGIRAAMAALTLFPLRSSVLLCSLRVRIPASKTPVGPFCAHTLARAKTRST